MPSLRKEREAAVDTLTKEFDGLQGLVVAGYVGVKTQELNDLRGKLRPLKARCQIVKNRLAKIALKNKGIDVGFAEFFKGQSALIIQKGDAVAGLKVLVEFEKSHANMKIRAGVLDGKVFNVGQLKAVASLPPRPVLLSQLLASCRASHSVRGGDDRRSSEFGKPVGTSRTKKKSRKRLVAQIWDVCPHGAKAPSSEEIWRNAQLMM
ncbi:MAG: 50S ribosomal protein L10 [Elusimicrobia bacterium]|nr:50S ribosomal protein L10 [Elusimicrobiota bacterium]